MQRAALIASVLCLCGAAAGCGGGDDDLSGDQDALIAYGGAYESGCTSILNAISDYGDEFNQGAQEDSNADVIRRYQVQTRMLLDALPDAYTRFERAEPPTQFTAFQRTVPGLKATVQRDVDRAKRKVNKETSAKEITAAEPTVQRAFTTAGSLDLPEELAGQATSCGRLPGQRSGGTTQR